MNLCVWVVKIFIFISIQRVKSCQNWVVQIVGSFKMPRNVVCFCYKPFGHSHHAYLPKSATDTNHSWLKLKLNSVHNDCGSAPLICGKMWTEHVTIGMIYEVPSMIYSKPWSPNNLSEVAKNGEKLPRLLLKSVRSCEALSQRFSKSSW